MASAQSISASANTVNNVWAMKNVPALKQESYTTTMGNHISKISFQLSAIRYPNEPPKMILRTWQSACEDLMKDEDFGASLTHANNFFNDDIRAAAAGASTPVEKAKKLFAYVRDNYTCTDEDAMYTS